MRARILALCLSLPLCLGLTLPAAAADVPFTDVQETSPDHDAILWAVENGITNGTTETTFSPDAPCTRAQLATFLWRAAGSPEMAEDPVFTDVAWEGSGFDGQPRYLEADDAVVWAVENGVISGTSETTFSSGSPCTRGQVITFLYRAANAA